MKNYVISLKDAEKRRNHILKEFGKASINFEFFDALSPASLFDFDNQFNLNLSDTLNLSLNEKACFASHVSLWQKMIDENLDFMSVFEDDVFLSARASRVLTSNDVLESFYNKQYFDVLKIETFNDLVHLNSETLKVSDDVFASQLKSVHTGAAGYILSRKGAQKMLSIVQSLDAIHVVPIDHILFDKFLKQTTVYQVNPAICIQEQWLKIDCDLPSQIELCRLAKRKVDLKKTRLQTIKDFRKRIFRSIGKRTFYQLVPYR